METGDHITAPGPREGLRLALACVETQDYDSAIAHLDAVLSVDSRDEVALGMLAAIHAEAGRPAQAIEFFLRVLDVNPANPLARFQLGLLQYSTQQPEQALATWQPALAHEQDFMAHFHSAAVLMQLGRVDEARPLLETAAVRMPSDHALYPALQELMQAT